MLTISSCNDDMHVSMPEEPRISVEASIAASPHTRTSLGALSEGTYPMLWSADDAIGVWSGSAFSDFTISQGAGTTVGTFYGSDAPQKVDGTSLYAVVYPLAQSTAAATADGGLQIGSRVRGLQNITNENIATNVFPMAGANLQADNFTYYNMGAVLDIPLRGDGAVFQVELWGNNKELLTGSIAMVFDSQGQPVVSSDEADNGCKLVRGDDGEWSVCANFGTEGLPLKGKADDVHVYFVIRPQTLENGFSIRIMDNNTGGDIIRTCTKRITFKRSYVYTMESMEYVQPTPIETANSYIITEGGKQSVPCFCQGNRVFQINETTGKYVEAGVLWSDCGMDAVTDVDYIPGRLKFTVKTDAEGNPVRGNVLVCIYDKNTMTVIWSWHLWLTDEPQVVYTDGYCADGTYTYKGVTVNAPASKTRLAIMDRNLGAMSANPNDGAKTFGLYYQAGRKDPFIGASQIGSCTRGALTALTNLPQFNGADEKIGSVYQQETTPFGDFTTPTEHDATLAPDGWKYQTFPLTLTESIQQPMTFSVTTVGCTSGQIPVWTDCNDVDNMSYMDVAGVRSTGLQKSGHEAYWNRTKTIMDPCPVGWTVLGERNGVYFKNGKFTPVFHPIFGLYYDWNGHRSFWPAAGVRTLLGTVADVGYRGAYWHYDHIEVNHGGHGDDFIYTSTTDRNGVVTEGYKFDIGGFGTGIITNNACPVRCVRMLQD